MNGLTPCCSRPRYEDPLFYDPTNCRFGTWSRCAKCHKLYGSPKIAYTIPKGIKESWNAYSEVATREFHKPGEGRPLRYFVGKQGLIPVGFKPAQVEIEVEEGL